MSERCKHVEKNGFNCGSYAFNLYKDGIDQGNLCDVHYWQAKALAQPEQDHIPDARKMVTEQEPVAVVDANDEGYWADILPDRNVKVGQLLYTTPPQRTWVGLTDEEIKKIAKKHKWHESNVAPHLMPVFRSLEAKLKEKNT